MDISALRAGADAAESRGHVLTADTMRLAADEIESLRENPTMPRKPPKEALENIEALLTYKNVEPIQFYDAIREVLGRD